MSYSITLLDLALKINIWKLSVQKKKKESLLKIFKKNEDDFYWKFLDLTYNYWFIDLIMCTCIRRCYIRECYAYFDDQEFKCNFCMHIRIKWRNKHWQPISFLGWSRVLHLKLFFGFLSWNIHMLYALGETGWTWAICTSLGIWPHFCGICYR